MLDKLDVTPEQKTVERTAAGHQRRVNDARGFAV
jgi:hypothetical protein